MIGLCCIAPAFTQAQTHDNRRTDPITRGRGELSGTVRNRKGNPVPKAAITLRDASIFAESPGMNRLIEATTDDDGRFSVAVTCGEYQLRAVGVGLLEYSAPVTIRGDAPTVVDIVLDSLVQR